MDEVKLHNIKSSAKRNSVRKCQVEVIEQIKSLFFPKPNWSEILYIDSPENTRWRTVVSELKRYSLVGDINPARIVFEQNLKDIGHNIFVQYRNTLISKNPEIATHKFFEQFEKAIKNYYISEYNFTNKEAEIYIKYIAKMSGLDKSALHVDAQNMDEYWLSSWLKLNKQMDEYHRRLYSTEIINQKDVIVDSRHRKKAPNEYGFDSYFITKSGRFYDVNVGELKVQSGTYDLVKRVDSHKSLKDFYRYIVRTMPYYYGYFFKLALEASGDVSPELSHDIIKALAERRMIMIDSMGQYFLLKLSNTPELYEDLVGELGEKVASVLYAIIKKQAQLCALIQHGIFKSFDDNKIHNSIVLRIKINGSIKPIQIPGEVFQLKISYDSNGGYLDVEGFSTEVLSRSSISKDKNPTEWNNYMRLEQILRNIIDSIQNRHIHDLISVVQDKDVFLMKCTEISMELFLELINIFEDFKILNNRKVNVNVILGSTNPKKYVKWLISKMSLYSSSPYFQIHAWNFPFKHYFEQRVDSNNEIHPNKSVSKLFVKLFGDNSLVDILKIDDKELLLSKIREQMMRFSKTEWDVSIASMILFLRKASPIKGISTRLFSSAGSKNLDFRGLVFLDSKGEPVQWDLGSTINTRDPYVNFIINLEDLISQYPHINKLILGNFPLDYKIEKGNFRMYFLRSAENKKNVNAILAKKEYMKRMKQVFSSDLKMLAHIKRMDNNITCLSSYDDVLCAVKIGIFCLLEYYQQWTMFSDAVIDLLHSFEEDYNQLPSAGYKNLQREGWMLKMKQIQASRSGNIKMKYEANHTNEETRKFKGKVSLGLANMKAPSEGVKYWRIKPDDDVIKLFPNHNPILKKIIKQVRVEARKISFSQDVSEEVVLNWRRFVQWLNDFVD